MRINKIIYWMVFLVQVLTLSAMPRESKIDKLSPEEFLTILRTYHPVIKQVMIDVEISQNQILQNRAAFDTKLRVSMGEKELKTENYYQYKELSVEIPTWYGIDIEAGMADFNGQRLDNSTTRGNSSYIGASLPLLKNLTYDKRRGYLEQAKIMNRLSIHEQRMAINQLILDAMKAYWDWVQAYETYKILNELVQNNISRFDFVKKSVNFGERPPIDTIEAYTQLLSFQIEKENKWTEFLNAGNELSIYLWHENESPYHLSPLIIPSSNWNHRFESSNPHLNFENMVNEGLSNHPEIKIYEEQINIYRVQRKIYFQDLLPKLDLNYRFLYPNSIQSFQINEARPFSQNYQYSLKLDIPLRLSEGRANYRSSKLKINSGELALQQKIQNISVKIKSYFNHYLNYEKLTKLQYENYLNYQAMVKAEDTRFQNGESNLFTINARELKALESLEKLIQLKVKYFKSIYEVKWSAGILK